MKPGNKIYLILIFCLLFTNFSIAEEKILTSPLINVEEIKPSFEEIDEEDEDILSSKNLKTKKKSSSLKSSQAILIGLDKITAKSSKFIVNLNESRKFGPLEIKILKCGKVKVNNKQMAKISCQPNRIKIVCDDTRFNKHSSLNIYTTFSQFEYFFVTFILCNYVFIWDVSFLLCPTQCMHACINDNPILIVTILPVGKQGMQWY